MKNINQQLIKDRSGEMSTGTQEEVTKLNLLKEMNGQEVWTDAFGERFGERVYVGVLYPFVVREGKKFRPTQEEIKDLWEDLMESEGISIQAFEEEFTPEYCKMILAEEEEEEEETKLSHRELREESKVNGRYTNSPKCECCKNPSGDNYYSHPECNNNGKFLHLCKKCGIKYTDTSMEEMLILFPQEEEEEEEETKKMWYKTGVCENCMDEYDEGYVPEKKLYKVGKETVCGNCAIMFSQDKRMYESAYGQEEEEEEEELNNQDNFDSYKEEHFGVSQDVYEGYFS